MEDTDIISYRGRSSSHRRDKSREQAEAESHPWQNLIISSATYEPNYISGSQQASYPNRALQNGNSCQLSTDQSTVLECALCHENDSVRICRFGSFRDRMLRQYNNLRSESNQRASLLLYYSSFHGRGQLGGDHFRSYLLQRRPNGRKRPKRLNE